LIDLSNKICLVFDPSGGFVHIAEALVGDFGQVKYFSPWERAFSSSRDYLPGHGLDGIERCWDFWDEIDSADLVVFPDVGNAGLQDWLRAQKMPVFGSGAASKLEQDRNYLKSVCKKYGIQTAECTQVVGIDNLRSLLAQIDDVHVKLSYFRGDMETFHHENQHDTMRRLNELALRMEPYGAQAEFVVEVPIKGKPCVEIGADIPNTAHGIYPRSVLWGYENKDKAYAGCVGALPERLNDVVNKLGPELERVGYRGALSTETRETPKGSFFLDMTCRFPNPPSALMRFMIDNWGELIWECAHGRVVEPNWLAPVGVQIIFKSEYGAENPLAVAVDRWDRTVLYGHAQFQGQDYAVSPSEIAECGAACGLGASLAQATEEALSVAESVKGRELGFDAGSVTELMETIQTGEKLGITWAGAFKEAA
jgi:phosphoribosylamine-glycine ligase